MLRFAVLGLLAALGLVWPESPAPEALPVAIFHDNELSAGNRSDGVLTLSLQAVEADWRPYGMAEAGNTQYAFAEVGGPPMIPAPYVQVELGTRVDVTIENTLDTTLVVTGFGERRSAGLEPWHIPPGETASKSFVADAEGTFYYWAIPTANPLRVARGIGGIQRIAPHMNGAFVVTGPEMPEPIDEVMIINVNTSLRRSTILTINGRPWPYTKRLEYAQGDTVRWRVLNLGNRSHPMHLHGFFFDVDQFGDNQRSSALWESEQSRLVTQNMTRGETMAISWVAERPGGWIFHCHISGHVGPNHRPLDRPITQAAVDTRRMLQVLGNPDHDPDHHVEQGMGGLMMGMYVSPAPDWAPDDRPRREMTLVINSDSVGAPVGTALERQGPHRRTFSPILREGTVDPAPDSVQVPGSTLVMRVGEPTSVWVVNRTPEPTQMHWHGLEIESPFDGVVGIGGYEGMPTPPIMPSDSFEMRFTPPRPGTYMYHTHMSDIRQQGAGLYGPIVVLDEGEEWDPVHDRVYIVGQSAAHQGPVVNGVKELAPETLPVGQYRFRFMVITNGAGATFSLRNMQNGFLDGWLLTSKDGADLPSHLQKAGDADLHLNVGETYDVMVTIGGPGTHTLRVRSGFRLDATQEITFVRGGG